MRVFEAENGNRTIAINEVQADAFIKAGLKEVDAKEPRGRGRPSQQ